MDRRRRKLIYLLGFMGSGKSTVGALLAQRLRWPFIDLDATIEAGQSATIRDIFENVGEPFFREIEHAALSEATKTEPAVIALGGGTFVQKPNLDLIHAAGGTTIWLECGLEELRRRCEGLNNRPLFRSAADFEQLFYQRLPYYQSADYRVSSGGVSPDEVVNEILRLRIF